jgi:hypothetical protein
MEVLFILYKSALPTEKVLDLFEERSNKYREVTGLLQKLYVHDEETGQVGGIYIFDSKKSLEAFRDSDLAGSISDAYRFTESPTKRVFRVAMTLYEMKKPPTT